MVCLFVRYAPCPALAAFANTFILKKLTHASATFSEAIIGKKLRFSQKANNLSLPSSKRLDKEKKLFFF